MSTHLANSPVQERSAGRGYLWLGIGLSVLGVALVVLQYSLHQLIIPWYMPALTTLGVLLLLGSLARRRSITRIVALVFVAAVIIGFTTAAVRARLIPTWAAPPAWLLGVYALAMSGAAFSVDRPLQGAVLAAFGAWLSSHLHRAGPGRARHLGAATLLFGVYIAIKLAMVHGIAAAAFPVVHCSRAISCRSRMDARASRHSRRSRRMQEPSASAMAR